MNRKMLFTVAGSLILAVLIGIGLGRAVFSGNPNRTHDTSVISGTITDRSAPTIWTCSMHPQIQQPEPGQCPICGMDLIPLVDDAKSDDGPRVMSMSEAARALAEIQTAEIRRIYPEAEVRLVGSLEYDETREKTLSARFPARIDELYVNFTGIRVRKGEHLANVYSPELFTAQRELLTSWRADPDSSITRAARDKLLLWDLLPDQIDEIIAQGEARDHFVLRAPIGGVVVAKNIKEGDYVKTGEPMFRIVDLDVLWAGLDAFESDLPWLRYGQDVSFSVESFPGETFHGKVAFIDPEVNRRTRTVPVRVNVLNEDGRLKPGMFVRGRVVSRLAAGGEVLAPELSGKWISPMHPEIVKDGPGKCDVCGMDLVPAEDLGYATDSAAPAPLIIPASAVLRTGKRSVVYVAMPNEDRPTYEGREIDLGPRAGEAFVVLGGLQAGDRVVTKGAFKIDSALQIRAKPSMMNPNGGGPAPGHDHGDGSRMEADEGSTVREGNVNVAIPKDLLPKILDPYLGIQSALAADDLEGAKSHARAMIGIVGHEGGLASLLHDMLAAETLEAFRRPDFDILSSAMINTAKKNPSAFQGALMVMHCPMVYEDHGADWLQTSEPLLNPYFGKAMSKCGEIKEIIGQAEDGHLHRDH